MSDKTSTWSNVQKQLKGLLQDSEMPWESALVSLLALIKESFPAVSWVGFYRNYDGHLWIGPYQGKLACTHIAPGRGVCGSAAERRKTLIVEDVEKFAGHIACDPLSRSEIVVPVWDASRKNLLGVLDLDSHLLGAFDATDQAGIEACLQTMSY